MQGCSAKRSWAAANRTVLSSAAWLACVPLHDSASSHSRWAQPTCELSTVSRFTGLADIGQVTGFLVKYSRCAPLDRHPNCVRRAARGGDVPPCRAEWAAPAIAPAASSDRRREESHEVATLSTPAARAESAGGAMMTGLLPGFRHLEACPQAYGFRPARAAAEATQALPTHNDARRDSG